MKKKLKQVPIKQSMHYDRNEKMCKGDDLPCIICGKPVKNAWGPDAWWLRAGPLSIRTVINRDSPDQGSAEMGCWPIGHDCYRKQPKEVKELAFRNGVEKEG